ncbi:MAG TPA: hypothetical protein VHV29_20150 [Terriglobales bacterium]|nr:hypothetical protein [Terriglobales bacterium]
MRSDYQLLSAQAVDRVSEIDNSRLAWIARALIIFLTPAAAFSQLPSHQCDISRDPVEYCAYLVSTQSSAIAARDSAAGMVPELTHGGTSAKTIDDIPDSTGGSSAAASEMFVQQSPPAKQGFHWGRALFESFTFLVIEQAYVVHDDYRWVVYENGVPFNHYWRDYKQSLHAWLESGWNDGDALMYGYVGHPIQGALTSFIQIQNDPRGDGLEFSNTKEYWHSRLRATLWNAAYSTQWNIGPLSEMTVEKYGTKVRSPWNQNGTWPCTEKHCYTGVGQIDLVMTPVGGFLWMLTEDLLDKNIARRLEGETRNHYLIDFTRCALNPIRGGASILHGRAPWYRARDARLIYLMNQTKKQNARSKADAGPQ